MLRALASAKRRGLGDFRFHVVGDGEDRGRLEALARELKIDSDVLFHGAVQYGEALFSRLYEFHLLLAAPLSEDTPRSALDAMASGQAVLAYDTYYYRELAAAGGGVDVVPWLDEQAFCQRLLEHCADRRRLGGLIGRSVAFARANTQEMWLGRRVEWTLDVLAGRAPSK
jgi:glycosyltransferase involved in cell wall biosynthesis